MSEDEQIRRQSIGSIPKVLFSPIGLAVLPTVLLVVFSQLRSPWFFGLWAVVGLILLLGMFLKMPIPEIDSELDEVWTPLRGILAVIVHALIVFFVWKYLGGS
jgi:uncharacterized membrane protein